MNDSYALLVRCARLAGDDAFYQQLAQQVSQFDEWSSLIPLAENHSLSPLLYRHLQHSESDIPAQARLQLQGLMLRHRQSNKIRLDTLADILAAFAAEGIHSLVLKGAVLADLVYPEPGLRPMSDLDLFVPAEAAHQAQAVLLDCGFELSTIAPPLLADADHLPVLALQRDGLIVSVEIHHTLINRRLASFVKTFDELMATSVPFSLGEQTDHRLGNAEMLWHLYHHMVSEHMRLIRIVDMVAFAEKFAEEIDWTVIRQESPKIIAALSVLHFVAPLSNRLQQAAGIVVGNRPSGTEIAMHDWPPLPRVRWGGKTNRQILQATFFPSEFSLRLYYGVPSNRAIFWRRWLQHPWQILYWWGQRRWSGRWTRRA